MGSAYNLANRLIIGIDGRLPKVYASTFFHPLVASSSQNPKQLCLVWYFGKAAILGRAKNNSLHYPDLQGKVNQSK
jgi:hypothetical protein